MGPSMIVDGDDEHVERPRSGAGASMGPSMIVDGDQRVKVFIGNRRVRFNGAVDDRRRRPGQASASALVWSSLQWGRR